jgi:predicted small secreted protein
MEQSIWFIFGLGLGLALDWVLVKFMLKDIKKRLSRLEVKNNLQALEKRNSNARG